MNVVVWARVSSGEQKEGYSIDAQLRATREKASKQGWTIAREFAVAESAKRGAERIAFNAMLAWVKSHAKRQNIKAILSHKLDRVCRNMRDAVRLQELDEDCGVQLAFVDNQFAPGAAGLLSFNVMAAVAQYYSDNLRTEVLKGMDEKVRQGWLAWRAPFGYINSDDGAEPIKIHPEESKALVRIFELYSSGAWTFERLARQLKSEGFIYCASQPVFARRTLSFILNNRFYIGEIRRHGEVFQGRHKLLIDRGTFEACQDVLQGKNRRTGHSQLAFAGGLIRCAYCGFAVTGERIRKKLKGGSVREHIYYRCGNNRKGPDHPPLRWRNEDLEAAIVADLESLKWPTPETAAVFRAVLKTSFVHFGAAHQFQRQQHLKRKTELAGMQDRLMNGYLLGAIEADGFRTKAASLKAELDAVENALSEPCRYEPAYGEAALALLDFGQHAADIWRGSNYSVRRKILESISLNRVLSDVSFVSEKRKPFDWMANSSNMKYGVPRGIRTPI